MEIWIVQGVHPHVPGCPIDAFFSERSANDAAAELVRIIQKDLGHEPVATTSTWADCLDVIKDNHEDCDVWISKVEPKD